MKARHLVLVVVAGFALTAEPDMRRWSAETGVVSQADARFGRRARLARPGPGWGAAGVARRTTRRVVRRTAVYTATLPRGCTDVTINGAPYHQCGTTYYEERSGQYVVVTVE